MSYTAEINRQNPGCFVFSIGSLRVNVGPLGGTQKAKADAVADAMNRLLSNLVVQCSKNEGVRDYFYVSVLGYGAQFGPALSGALAGLAQLRSR